MRYIPENNLAYPILIKMDTSSCGSGFFLKHENVLYLVTAKHVFINQNDNTFLCSKEFTLISYSQDISIKEPIQITIQLESVKEKIKKHSVSDTVVIKIGNIKIDEKTKSETSFFLTGVKVVSMPKGASMVWVDSKFFKKYDDVFVSNEIFILGYPVSIGQKNYEQIDVNKPLLRTGIVAGKNERKRTIILDAPVYFGNSGGLVLEVDAKPNGERLFLPIGIISEYVPFVEELYSLQHKEVVSINRANSGYSIAVPIDTILDLI